MAKDQALIKVISDNISSSEISSEIKLDLSDIPKSQRDDVKDQVGNFLLEQVLQTVGSKSSPIQGKDWPKLSKEYAKEKKAEGYDPVPNLEATGAMLGSLEFKMTPDGIKLGIFGDKEEVAKADGHNNFSGESKIPTRQFLPKSGENFDTDITKQIENIILDAKASAADVAKSDFKDVETKKDLYDKLGELIGDALSRTELKYIVLRSEEISGILDELGLLELL